MPSADFCPAVRMPHDILSRRSDTEQISWGKLSRFPCRVAGSTLRILDGYGLRGKWPARPTLAPSTRCLSIDSHVCCTLPSDLASNAIKRRPTPFVHARGGCHQPPATTSPRASSRCRPARASPRTSQYSKSPSNEFEYGRVADRADLQSSDIGAAERRCLNLKWFC